MLGNFEVMSFCDPAMRTAQRAFPDGVADHLGVRRSNTEPIVRVVVESADAQWVAHVVNRIHAL
jgi:phosphomannomutase